MPLPSSEFNGRARGARRRRHLGTAIVLLLGGSVWLGGCQTTPTPPVVQATPAAASSPAFFRTYARFYLESTNASAAMMTLPISGVEIGVGNRAVLTEFDIVDAEAVQVDLGRCLRVKLTPAATREISRLTRENLGMRLVLTINDEAIGARRIEGPMTDGTVYIFTEIPDETLNELAVNLHRTSSEVQKEAMKK